MVNNFQEEIWQTKPNLMVETHRHYELQDMIYWEEQNISSVAFLPKAQQTNHEKTTDSN